MLINAYAMTCVEKPPFNQAYQQQGNRGAPRFRESICQGMLEFSRKCDGETRLSRVIDQRHYKPL